MRPFRVSYTFLCGSFFTSRKEGKSQHCQRWGNCPIGLYSCLLGTLTWIEQIHDQSFCHIVVGSTHTGGSVRTACRFVLGKSSPDTCYSYRVTDIPTTFYKLVWYKVIIKGAASMHTIVCGLFCYNLSREGIPRLSLLGSHRSKLSTSCDMMGSKGNFC